MILPPRRSCVAGIRDFGAVPTGSHPVDAHPRPGLDHSAVPAPMERMAVIEPALYAWEATARRPSIPCLTCVDRPWRARPGAFGKPILTAVDRPVGHAFAVLAAEEARAAWIARDRAWLVGRPCVGLLQQAGSWRGRGRHPRQLDIRPKAGPSRSGPGTRPGWTRRRSRRTLPCSPGCGQHCNEPSSLRQVPARWVSGSCDTPTVPWPS